MNKNIVELITLFAVFFYFLNDLKNVPHHHADVGYIIFLAVLGIVSVIWSIIAPHKLFHSISLLGIWVAFYVVNSIRYGFDVGGFVSHCVTGIVVGIVLFGLNALVLNLKKK